MSRMHPEGEPTLRPIERETVSAADGPVDVYLAHQRLQIVDPERDLGGEWNVDYLIIDPAAFDQENKRGFKGISDGESVVLGRRSRHERFLFFPNVSKEHVRITRHGDEFEIMDLDSLNGTYLEAATDPNRRKTAPLKSPDADETPEIALVETDPDWKPAFHVAGESVASELHPDENEDAYFIAADSGAIGVFDGASTAAGSGQASETAARSVERHLRELPEHPPLALAQQAIRESLENAHEQIVQEADPDDNPATTATVGKVFEAEGGSRYLVVGSVGDSRAYLFRGGEINHLTLDQAYMPSLATTQRKRIQETLASATDLSQLSAVELEQFQNRNVISGYLGRGHRPPVVVMTELEVFAGDRLLITSDGIHDNLTDSEVEAVLRSNSDSDQAVRELAAAALERSHDRQHIRAKSDDMTAAILDCDTAK